MKYKLGDLIQDCFTGHYGYIVNEEDKGEVEVCWFNARVINHPQPAYTTWASVTYIKKVNHDKR